jgi:hypothetical protein
MIYYLDYLNSGIVNDGAPANLASTVRLYNSRDNKLLLIAPYSSAPTFTVNHEWTDVSKSLSGAIAKGIKAGKELATQIMQSLSQLATEVDDNFAADPSYSAAYLSAADAMKSFKGTTISSGITSISTTMMSDVSTIKSIGLVPNMSDSETQPLKKYLLALNNIFVGKNSWDDNDKRSSGISNNRADQDIVDGEGTLVGKVLPPNNFSVDSNRFHRNIKGSFYLVAGSNDVVVRGLLLKSYTITPSKLMTTTGNDRAGSSALTTSNSFSSDSGDYYYATITLEFESGRYMLKSDLDSWIGS